MRTLVTVAMDSPRSQMSMIFGLGMAAARASLQELNEPLAGSLASFSMLRTCRPVMVNAATPTPVVTSDVQKRTRAVLPGRSGGSFDWAGVGIAGAGTGRAATAAGSSDTLRSVLLSGRTSTLL